MEIMIIGWLILSAFCGWIAAQKGRSFIAWMLLSVVLSPLIAIIGLIAVPALPSTRATQDYDPHHRRHHTPSDGGISIADLPQRGAYQPSDSRPSTSRSDMGFPDLPPRRDE